MTTNMTPSTTAEAPAAADTPPRSSHGTSHAVPLGCTSHSVCRRGNGGGNERCGDIDEAAAAAAAATAAAGADPVLVRDGPLLGVQQRGVAPEAGVLAPLQGVLSGLSAPAVAAAMALERAALRLNSMLLLLGIAMARPCSSRVTTVMLSVESKRCARSTKALAAFSGSRARDRARRVAATT